jgi:SAM-dependent methyltransferase
VNANRALWEKGDFTRIAESMRQSGEQLVKGLGLVPGLRVLDVGCGDGTTAIPAAREGADVLGVDIASNLVAAGNARARELGLGNCRIQEGDASDLKGIGDEQFDLVLSMFGAMFAPRPSDVARELVRVARPGGRIVMGNWIPGDPTLVAQILRISAAYSPPPPQGFVSPMKWGVEDQVIDRFTSAGISQEQISCERDTWTFRSPGSPQELLAEFRDYYGPTMNALKPPEPPVGSWTSKVSWRRSSESRTRATTGHPSLPRFCVSPSIDSARSAGIRGSSWVYERGDAGPISYC